MSSPPRRLRVGVHRPAVFEPLPAKLVYPSGVVGFCKGHRGMPFASGALMDPITKDFVSIHRFVDQHPQLEDLGFTVTLAAATGTSA